VPGVKPRNMVVPKQKVYDPTLMLGLRLPPRSGGKISTEEALEQCAADP
jgi:hypothetical protein